jgi:hypothetical protein
LLFSSCAPWFRRCCCCISGIQQGLVFIGRHLNFIVISLEFFSVQRQNLPFALLEELTSSLCTNKDNATHVFLSSDFGQVHRCFLGSLIALKLLQLGDGGLRLCLYSLHYFDWLLGLQCFGRCFPASNLALLGCLDSFSSINSFFLSSLNVFSLQSKFFLLALVVFELFYILRLCLSVVCLVTHPYNCRFL